MDEIKFSVLARQCLLKRIESIDTLQQQVLHWAKDRNSPAAKIIWSFTVDIAM
jgi:hypothetical protein